VFALLNTNHFFVVGNLFMASDRFEIEPAPVEKSGWGSCLMGCLIGATIVVLMGAGAAWWVLNNWKGWLVTGGTQVIEAGIDDSKLPDQEKVELKAELKRLRNGYREGKISDEQVLRVVETLVQSPLMRMLIVAAVETHYVVNSGLSDEEKTDAKVELQRFASGMMSKKISQEDLDEVLSHIADRDENGNLKIRETVSDKELREFLAAVAKKADAAEIPAKIEPVDPSDTLKQIIDNALAAP